jgi:hypothetical protein
VAVDFRQQTGRSAGKFRDRRVQLLKNPDEHLRKITRTAPQIFRESDNTSFGHFTLGCVLRRPLGCLFQFRSPGKILGVVTRPQLL